MNSSEPSVIRFIDPSTSVGAVILAVLMLILAWAICVVTSRLMQRPNWVIGKFQRRVDETVIRYVVKIKNLLIFLIVGFSYASLVPSLRALVGTLIDSAGITDFVVGFAAKST